MRISIADFKGQNYLSIDKTIAPKELDLDIGVMRFAEGLRMNLEAWLDGHQMTVQVALKGEKIFACSRCLEEFNNLFEKQATLYYDMRDSNSVVLDQDIRDELIVDHPIAIFCRPDCRGLCAACGENLNAGPCRCSKESTD
jgi:uncharacterized metal-binding protein YceD (DUF177 family)